MASITVSKGKVTNVKNGTKSNTNLSSNYTKGKSTDYNKSVQSASSSQNTPSTVAQLPSEGINNGSNVSANTPVIGSMDAPYYGITSNNTPVIGSMDGNKSTSVNRSSYGINPTDDKISSNANSVKYNPDDPGGYASRDGLDGNTYSARQTAYVFTDENGQHTVYSNYTNYNDAKNAAVAEGMISPNAKLSHASTYGTGSLGTEKGHNYGGTVGGNGYSGFGADAYISDKQYSNMYDQNNMQLAYLSGRDGMDYTNPYAGLAYNGDGLNNAYLKGIENSGTGNAAGSYGLGQAGLNNDVLANGTSGYQGLTQSDIQNRMDDILSNYGNAIDDVNDSITAGYNYQKRQNEQSAEDNARALYLQKVIAEKNMPKQLAAQGISGGLTESSLTGINSNYQNAYNENQQTLTDTNTQLEIAKQQAVSQNNLTAAQYYADIQQTTLQLQQAAADAQNSYNLAVAQMQQARTESDRAYALQMAQYSNELATQTYEREYAELQNKISYAYQLGDLDTVGKLLDVDTKVAKQLQDLDYKSKLLSYDTSSYNLSQKKTKSVSGSVAKLSNDNSNYSEASDAVNSYLNRIRNSPYGAIYVGGINEMLTANDIKNALNSGQLDTDYTDGKLTIGTPEYLTARGL